MTNWKELCRELSEHLALLDEPPHQLVCKVEEALAQPEPGVEGELTDQELLRCANIGTPCYDLKGWERELRMMRAAIATDRSRFGRVDLAQPEPEVEGPTDDKIPPVPFSEHDLQQQWNQQADEFNQWDSLGSDEQLEWAQARAIAADRSRRTLAQPEHEGPSGDEIYKLALEGDFLVDAGDGFTCMVQDEVGFARAVLARFGRPAPAPAEELLKEAAWLRNECSSENAEGNWISMSIDQALDLASLLERQAAPAPAEGEVGEIVAVLRNSVVSDDEHSSQFEPKFITLIADLLERLDRYEKALSAVMPSDFKDWWQNSKDDWPDVASGVIESLRKREQLAWEQLQRLAATEDCSATAPVPVSERLPGAEDCDAEGKCWWFNPGQPAISNPHIATSSWRLCRTLNGKPMGTHWIPANALPLPSKEVKL